MELLFLGRGSAFNPEEGTNSAYFIENRVLFLIDSGETTFERLIKNNLLNNIDQVYIMITHTHSDHIGSMGTLISYLYHKKNIITKIIIPKQKRKRYYDYIEMILKLTGCTDKYIFINEEELDNKYKSFTTIRFKETTHSENLECYGILFNTDKGFIYYSGDTNELNNVKELIDNNCLIDRLYLDTTTSENDSHLNINYINKEIPSNIKNKVYCMHIDSKESIENIKKLGFKVVDINK